MIATILVFRQLNYMQKQDPGFDRDQVITIPAMEITSVNMSLLKKELSASPLVTGVTGAWYELGNRLGTLRFGVLAGQRPDAGTVHSRDVRGSQLSERL